MKRIPLASLFLLFILLCMSCAYWGMQMFKPPVRAVAAVAAVERPDAPIDAAAGLFGGRLGGVAVASNYALKGVVVASVPSESIAIIAADGKPAVSVRVNAEVAPGVVVKEVYKLYVVLSEGGMSKRVELPDPAKGARVGEADALIPAAVALPPGQGVIPGAQMPPQQQPMAPPQAMAPPSMNVQTPPPQAQPPQPTQPGMQPNLGGNPGGNPNSQPPGMTPAN